MAEVNLNGIAESLLERKKLVMNPWGGGDSKWIKGGEKRSEDVVEQ